VAAAVRRVGGVWPGSGFYAPGMATKYEYLCEEKPGYDREITDYLNGRAAEGWEVVSIQFVTDRPPHVWVVWRR
jgi:hypothetical protein